MSRATGHRAGWRHIQRLQSLPPVAATAALQHRRAGHGPQALSAPQFGYYCCLSRQPRRAQSVQDRRTAPTITSSGRPSASPRARCLTSPFPKSPWGARNWDPTSCNPQARGRPPIMPQISALSPKWPGPISSHLFPVDSLIRQQRFFGLIQHVQIDSTAA